MTQEEIAIKLNLLHQRVSTLEDSVAKWEKLQEQINKLTVATNSLASSIKVMVTDQKDLGKRIARLEGEPAERWNSMQRTLFTSIVSAIGTALAIGLISLIKQNM